MRRPRSFIGPAGMGGMVGLWGASSLIKSIQRGTVTLSAVHSNTATISAVDTANTIVTFGVSHDNNSTITWAYYLSYVELTNATTITVTRGATTEATLGYCPYEVIEFMPGVIRSVQRGVQTINGYSGTYTTVLSGLSSISKASYTNLGWAGDTNNFYAYFLPRGALTSTTALTWTALYSGGGLGYQMAWQVVEWY